MRFHWTEYLSGDISEALNLLEEFWIYITLEKKNDKWLVWAGDQVMLSCNTQEEAHAFVLGQAISYVSLPENIQEEVKEAFSP